MLRIEASVEDVGGEDRVGHPVCDQGAKRLELDIGPDIGHIHHPQVGVSAGAALPGIVLQRRLHPNGPMSPHERLRLRADRGRIRAEAAPDRADDRIRRVDVEVDHRGQVEPDADAGQRLRDGPPGRLRLPRVPDGPELGRRARRWEPMRRAEARDLAALLVDRHEERRAARVAQRCNERPQLLGRDDVAHRGAGRRVEVEEQHAAQASVVNIGQDGGRLFGRRSTEADEQHLCDLRTKIGCGRWARGGRAAR